MNLLEKIKKFWDKKAPVYSSEKDKATAAHEPWVSVVGFEIDPENLSDGAFDLDWNDVFLARLVKAGYRGKNDQEIVDQWFNSVCQLVVSDDYGQEMADPEKRKLLKKKQLEDGRTEHS